MRPEGLNMRGIFSFPIGPVGVDGADAGRGAGDAARSDII
jgi:hypothetical protein